MSIKSLQGHLIVVWIVVSGLTNAVNVRLSTSALAPPMLTNLTVKLFCHSGESIVNRNISRINTEFVQKL